MGQPSVSNIVVEMIVRAADRAGLPLEELCAGLPVTALRLRYWLGGLEWPLFVELLERFERRVGPAALDEAVVALPDVAPTGKRLLERIVGPRALMSFVCRVMGPMMYPMYEQHYREQELDDGSVVAHLSLRLRDGLAGSRIIFRLHGPAIAAVPTFIGQAPFPVRAEFDERGGDYWFTLRPPRE